MERGVGWAGPERVEREEDESREREGEQSQRKERGREGGRRESRGRRKEEDEVINVQERGSERKAEKHDYRSDLLQLDVLDENGV